MVRAVVILLFSVLLCCDNVLSWGGRHRGGFYSHNNHYGGGGDYYHNQNNDNFAVASNNDQKVAAIVDQGETVGRFRRQNNTGNNSNSNTCRVQNNRVLGQWRCDNGDVIDCNDLCNGRRNCADGSDETVISCRNVFCLDSAFRCSYGACIRSEFECNGVQDCADGSDEKTLRCPGVLNSIRSGGNCNEGFFQCKSGECVYDDGVCSGGAECPDGSDETAAVCSTHFCPEPAFRCDYGACILRMNRCDGKRDCVDGSDEKPELCANVTAINSGFNFGPSVAPPPPPPSQVETIRPSTGTLPQSATSAINQMLSTMPTVGPSTTNRDALNIVAAYRRLLLRLELQVLELQQQNLRLRLNAFDSGIRDLSELPIRDSGVVGETSDFSSFEPSLSNPGSGFTFNSPTNSPIRIPPAASPPTTPTSPRPVLSNDPATATTPGRTPVAGGNTPTPPPISNEPREEGDCDAPVLQGGRVSDVYSRRYDGRFVKNGEMIIFECSAGTSLIGANSTYCIRGTLLNELPQCTNFCSGLPLNTLSVQGECYNPNGDKIPCAPLLPPRTIAILSCKVGYKKPDRVVPDAYTCMDDGNWNAHVYKCQQICGEVTEGRRFIVGGAETNITRVPWHAGIYEMINGRMEQICGGSILNPTSIVTAAHCFWDQARGQIKEASLYAVAVGKTLRDFDASEVTVQTFQVVTIDVYDQYRDYEGLFVSDIAVVVLEKPIIFQSYIKPVCVDFNLKGNQRYVVSGIQGRVAGWGLTASGGLPSPLLKTIDLPTVDFNTCLNESPPSFRPFITTDKFCAGFTTGDSVCTGDSGGGLAFAQQGGDNTTSYFLRGIVSTGPRLEGSCDNTKYSAFTDVQLNIIFLYKYIVN